MPFLAFIHIYPILEQWFLKYLTCLWISYFIRDTINSFTMGISFGSCLKGISGAPNVFANIDLDEV